MIPVIWPILDLLIHLLCGILTHTVSPTRNSPWISYSSGLATGSINILYLEIAGMYDVMLVGAVELEMPPFGVTASVMEHRFLVAIVCTFLWLLSTIRFHARWFIGKPEWKMYTPITQELPKVLVGRCGAVVSQRITQRVSHTHKIWTSAGVRHLPTQGTSDGKSRGTTTINKSKCKIVATVIMSDIHS